MKITKEQVLDLVNDLNKNFENKYQVLTSLDNCSYKIVVTTLAGTDELLLEIHDSGMIKPGSLPDYDASNYVIRWQSALFKKDEFKVSGHGSHIGCSCVPKEWLNDNDSQSSLRKAKININIDDSKLKKMLDDVDYMSNKLLQIKGFYKDDFKRIRDEHLLAADDSAPVFKSPDDMLMYEASLLQDKIKHGEYKNHDQLMELHKAIMEINRLMKSPKLNDINFKPMTNKEMTKFVGDAIDENVKNLMQDL